MDRASRVFFSGRENKKRRVVRWGRLYVVVVAVGEKIHDLAHACPPAALVLKERTGAHKTNRTKHSRRYMVAVVVVACVRLGVVEL